MKKILIVEDELIVRSIYRRKFEISGFQVETAEEGVGRAEFDGDFQAGRRAGGSGLPGMDGVEVIRQIRSWPDFKTTPILVISSFYRPDLAAEAWKAGATKCVSKMDCTPNLALELIEQMLGGRCRVAAFRQIWHSGHARRAERGRFVCCPRNRRGKRPPRLSRASRNLRPAPPPPPARRPWFCPRRPKPSPPCPNLA